MENTNLKEGTRVYYGGDMANEEGFGVITHQVTDKWGTWVNISFDDGRDFMRISVVAFSDEYLGHGGTRFVTEEAYKAYRQAQIAKVEATLAERLPELKCKECGKKLTKPIERHDGECRPCRAYRIAVEERDEYRKRKKERARVGEDELDAMLEDASREAEKRGESDLDPMPAKCPECDEDWEHGCSTETLPYMIIVQCAGCSKKFWYKKEGS